MSFKNYLLSGISMLAIVASAGALTDATAAMGKKDDGKVVNVYSARHYDVDKKIYNAFTKKTGIKVNTIAGKAPEILGRLKSEGADTAADLFLTADIANIYQAVEAGLTMPIESKVINGNVPANLRGQDNEWVALTKRARILVYDSKKTDPAMLSTYAALTDKKFMGKIVVRGSSSSYNQSLLASIIAETSEAEAKKWAAGIVKNMARPPKGNDRDQVKAIVAGVGDIAIVNTYYIGRMLNSDDPEEVKVAKQVSVFFPEKTHINVSGATLIKYSKNKENAIKLLEYLTSPAAQALYVNENYEYPANPKVKLTPFLKGFGDFTPQDVHLNEVGKNNRKATEIFGQVGWK